VNSDFGGIKQESFGLPSRVKRRWGKGRFRVDEVFTVITLYTKDIANNKTNIRVILAYRPLNRITSNI